MTERDAHIPRSQASIEEEMRLVDQAKTDPDAFGELYERYFDKIHQHMYHRVGNATDAEDLTSKVFYRAFKGIGGYKDMGKPFGVWLLTIGHNQLVDYYRARKEIVYFDDSLRSGLFTGDDTDPHTRVEKDIKAEHLRQAIMSLKRNQRAVVIMRYLGGMEYKDIATVLGKPEAAVRVINYRSLLALRDKLQAESLFQEDESVGDGSESEVGYWGLAKMVGLSRLDVQSLINQAERDGQLQLKAKKGGNGPKKRTFCKEDQQAILDYIQPLSHK